MKSGENELRSKDQDDNRKSVKIKTGTRKTTVSRKKVKGAVEKTGMVFKMGDCKVLTQDQARELVNTIVLKHLKQLKAQMGKLKTGYERSEGWDAGYSFGITRCMEAIDKKIEKIKAL